MFQGEENTENMNSARGRHWLMLGLGLRWLSILSPQSGVSVGGLPGSDAEGPVGRHITLGSTQIERRGHSNSKPHNVW